MPRTCCGPAVPTTRFQQPEAVSPLLAKILHVRRTELRRTLQVAGFAIVVGWAMYTAFSAAQSIFLNKAGPHAYPLFFIVLALTAWPMAALQGALTRRFGVGRSFRIVLVANAVAAVGVFTAYTIREDATVAFGAYVLYSVAFELVMLNFWSFATQHFNVLEGKRIFPVIAAGSSVGYILSGLTTTIVAVFATEPLIFVWAFGSLAAAIISVGLERTLFRPAFIDDADQLLVEQEVERKRHGGPALLRRGFEYLTGSRLVLALVLLVLVFQVASRVGDYLVAVLFVSATHNNLQELTILIGNAWLATYVVQLVVSLFVTPWVLNRLGVKNAILVLPAFTLVGFTAVAVNPFLGTALFLFIVRNGLQTGLDDPAQNVLGGALPAQVVPRLRFLLNNVVLPLAAVLTGFGLFLVQPAIVASVEVLAVVGIAIGALFIFAAWRVRSLYVDAIYARLRTHGDSSASGDRAAAAWAAAFVGDDTTVAGAMSDDDPRVRLEAIRSFARMKGQVSGVADALLACLRDSDVGVRREALRQAVRWTPPAAVKQAFAEALVDCLASGARDVRRVAAEAMAAQAPEALMLTLPLLLLHDETSAAAVEALVRSGRPELYRHVREHLEMHLASGAQMARLSARIWGAMRRMDGDQAAGYALLRIGLEDYIHSAAESGLAAMRALHGKRGFATVERGLVSMHVQTRVEALETLLNFGPGWLAGPLARLLDPGDFDPVLARPLSQAELEALANHPDKWVRETAEAARSGLNEQMKELIALKQVPLFSTLTLEQLASIDRLMVTRHYVKGERVFRKGDIGAELYVIVDGEIRVYLDHAGSQVTLTKQGAGTVVGEMSVFDEQPRSASALASTDTTVRVLRRDRLHAIVNEHPEVLLEFIKNLSQRLRAMDEKVESAPPALRATSP